MTEDIWAARGKIGTKLALQRDSEGGYIKFDIRENEEQAEKLRESVELLVAAGYFRARIKGLSAFDKFDIRENEEQAEKLRESVELLVAAGYFRARIKGLSAFDKVVGGMAWCISVCNIQIDVDLLYQENSTIGQKIHLTEKIVHVLRQIKCPAPIEPHQIQGLDMISIFPVVQWLVKLALETREERSQAIRSFYIWKFDSAHKWMQDENEAEKTKKVVELLSSLDRKRIPQRRFRRRHDNSDQPLEVRVRTTLQEYADAAALGADKSTGDHKELDETSEDMLRIDESELRMPVNVIASMIDQDPSQPRAEAVQQRNSVHPADHEQLTALKATHDALKEQHQQVSAELKQVRDADEELSTRLHALQDVESGVDVETTGTLEELTAKYEAVKEAEQSYKQWCKAEFSTLNEELERLTSERSSNIQEVTPELQERHEEILNRLQDARLRLAAKNQEIAVLQRKADDVPSRAELNQYQRRFLELYNQMGSKHRETKQYYTLYNTLQDIKEYMEKEVNLLDSIYDNYQAAMQSPTGKSQLLTQIEQIVDGLKDAKAKLKVNYNNEKSKRHTFKEERAQLLEHERQYLQAVKQFQEACRENELQRAGRA